MLRGGEVLTGELIGIDNGALTFSTSLSGQMMTSTEQVASISTDLHLRISMLDEAPARGRFVVRDGVTYLEAQDGVLGKPIDLAQVRHAAPLASGAAAPGTPHTDGLEVSVETGVRRRYGNADYTDVFIRLGLAHDGDTDGFRHEVMVERADPDRFPRWFYGEAYWRLGPAKGLFPIVGAEVERDTDMALSARGSLSLALGKRLVDNEHRRIEGDLGVGGTVEYFDADELDSAIRQSLEAQRRIDDPTRREQAGHLRLTLRYAQALFNRGAIEEHLRVYPSIVSLGEFRARSRSSVLVPVTGDLKLKLDLFVDYESTPEFRDLDNWRTSVGASVQWNF